MGFYSLIFNLFWGIIMVTIKLTIDDKELEDEEGTTILESARKLDIYIPAICYDPALSPYGGCRLCIVEIEGMDALPTACATEIAEDMVVHTNTAI